MASDTAFCREERLKTLEASRLLTAAASPAAVDAYSPSPDHSRGLIAGWRMPLGGAADLNSRFAV
jgi:hypothetical protein